MSQITYISYAIYCSIYPPVPYAVSYYLYHTSQQYIISFAFIYLFIYLLLLCWVGVYCVFIKVLTVYQNILGCDPYTILLYLLFSQVLLLKGNVHFLGLPTYLTFLMLFFLKFLVSIIFLQSEKLSLAFLILYTCT
jgi:hypothetical protein